MVGGSLFGIFPKYEARFRGIAVLESYRRQGIGRKIVQFALDLAKDQGHKYIWALPKTHTLRMYTGLGFTQVGKSIKAEFANNCYVWRDT